MKNPAFAVALSAVLSTSFIATAQADKLDDIIASAWAWHSTHLDGYDSTPSP